ncbi:hypothetical protein QSJ18_16560 [Gordonia sp. ABSL1-1]|uniref:hypothetical protein n=1 Tax=Gordonia sp. ABSL1-1 TaxID=3053923 RepID=UPI00257368F8|nr:hypothetical protein [Gordonia sp. ABSL1-1]MDL9938365.1 hypothetical protein [Gordonia sp. ABSL1-1]
MKHGDRTSLAPAIGRVAIESAECDDRLRTILNDLSSLSDGVWLLYEGQPTEWLISTIEMMVREINPYFNAWPDELNARLIASLRELKALRDRRNTVIHGTWEPVTEDLRRLHEGNIKPRPWGVWDQSEEWYCFRSRFRKYDGPHTFSISDIDILAKRISESAGGAISAYAAIRRHRYPDIFDATLWGRWA